MELSAANYKPYLNEISELYMRCFGLGKSAQYLEISTVKNYFEYLFLNDAKALVIENESCIVALILFCPFALDTEAPETLKVRFCAEKSLYIAELMVDEEQRGKGQAKILIQQVIEYCSVKRYTDALIRVWSENMIAVKLYKKVGFDEIATITQQKIKANQQGLFEMTKIYLWKKID
jgi:ribosomal protein S18 acetylase RimI-like enzyme